MGARGAGRLEPLTPPTGLHLTLPHCPLSRSGPDPALCTPKLPSLKDGRERTPVSAPQGVQDSVLGELQGSGQPAKGELQRGNSNRNRIE